MLTGVGNLTFNGPVAYAGVIPAGWDLYSVGGYFFLFIALWTILYIAIVKFD